MVNERKLLPSNYKASYLSSNSELWQRTNQQPAEEEEIKRRRWGMDWAHLTQTSDQQQGKHLKQTVDQEKLGAETWRQTWRT
jgi:hypothetical protein